ncbi:hypothetical protein [Rhodococcus qingshengii]|uniref:hypothetical protein n=1 Tax=Rhodococcus qingshengii TaxID=334542 RepID=UPI0035D745A7
MAPSTAHLTAVARDLKRELNGQAFLTLKRMDITTRIRQVSGEARTKLRPGMAAELTRELNEQAVQVHPPLTESSMFDSIRLCHAGSLLSRVQKVIVEPSPESDKELGDLLRKIKGQWEWSEKTD